MYKFVVFQKFVAETVPMTLLVNGLILEQRLERKMVDFL